MKLTLEHHENVIQKYNARGNAMLVQMKYKMKNAMLCAKSDAIVLQRQIQRNLKLMRTVKKRFI